MNTLNTALLTLMLGLPWLANGADLAPTPSETRQDQDENAWVGVVNAINVPEGTLVVGDSTAYFTTGTVITKGKGPASVQDIRVGSEVKLIINPGGQKGRPPYLTHIQILQ